MVVILVLRHMHVGLKVLTPAANAASRRAMYASAASGCSLPYGFTSTSRPAGSSPGVTWRSVDGNTSL